MGYKCDLSRISRLCLQFPDRILKQEGNLLFLFYQQNGICPFFSDSSCGMTQYIWKGLYIHLKSMAKTPWKQASLDLTTEPLLLSYRREVYVIWRACHWSPASVEIAKLSTKCIHLENVTTVCHFLCTGFKWTLLVTVFKFDLGYLQGTHLWEAR